MFSAVDDVAQGFLVFFFSKRFELQIGLVCEELFNFSHGNFVDFDEMFLELLLIDFRGLRVESMHVFLEDFKPVSFSDIDFYHLFPEFKATEIDLVIGIVPWRAADFRPISVATIKLNRIIKLSALFLQHFLSRQFDKIVVKQKDDLLRKALRELGLEF